MDRKIELNLCAAMAWGAWALTFALIGTGYLLDEMSLSALGLAMAAAAATLHVRCFIRAQTEREVEAFQLGQETVRAIR